MDFRQMFNRMTEGKTFNFAQTHHFDQVPDFSWVELGLLTKGNMDPKMKVPSEPLALGIVV